MTPRSTTCASGSMRHARPDLEGGFWRALHALLRPHIGRAEMLPEIANVALCKHPQKQAA